MLYNNYFEKFLCSTMSDELSDNLDGNELPQQGQPLNELDKNSLCDNSNHPLEHTYSHMECVSRPKNVHIQKAPKKRGRPSLKRACLSFANSKKKKRTEKQRRHPNSFNSLSEAERAKGQYKVLQT